ncbi:hypothetical protein [Caulobacter phage Cr30]|uniref:hypothetical protein n=1 Tax=Caulobacter phage Cr30 TaxID=1357714 RepID=UPI0004A9B4C5|nr:hypothetical protein OZ74_gp209 [Caulobacter phage Cr30]AGS81134.1 hypothetical protein [Caulobacter phage Cr30]
MYYLIIGLTLFLAASGGMNFLADWTRIETWKQFIARYWAGWNVFVTMVFAITFILVSTLGIFKFD